MAAALSVRVQTGAPAGSKSAAQTGIDLITADNDTNTLGNRQANPITIPAAGNDFSFEKWLRLEIDTAPDNAVTNFKFWSAEGGAEGVATGVTIEGEGDIVAYAQPVVTERAGAVALPTTQGGASVWDTQSLTSVGNLTDHLVLQLTVASTASAGNVPQITIDFSYDET